MENDLLDDLHYGVWLRKREKKREGNAHTRENTRVNGMERTELNITELNIILSYKRMDK